MDNQLSLYQPQSDSIVIYHSEDETVELEVQLSDETVWLTQQQMTSLFETTKQNVSLHINNIFREGELVRSAVVKDCLTTATDGKNYHVQYYNLDVIISVGYRVKSQRGTQFRQWANRVLKEYLLRGYSINQHLLLMEQRINHQLQEHTEQIHHLEKQVDFFVRTSQPPVEGIFYDGQIFDAYAFVSNLIKSAKKSIVLIDNYIDESVLLMLSKRADNVDAKIITRHITQQFAVDLQRHNQQYPSVAIEENKRYHDRFLVIDETVYHLGASLKDLGKKLFAFSKMETPKKLILP